jgi:hypothetical protein
MFNLGLFCLKKKKNQKTTCTHKKGPLESLDSKASLMANVKALKSHSTKPDIVVDVCNPSNLREAETG